MSLDGFLTFLALLVALPALATNVTRLQVSLRATTPFLLAIITVAAVLYFEFFEITGRPCFLDKAACHWLELGRAGWFDAEQVAFAIVLAWCMVAWACLSGRRLFPGHLPRLAKLAEALAVERRWADLCQLLAPHLPLIVDVYERKRGWARWQDRLMPSSAQFLLAYVARGVDGPTIGTRFWAWLTPVRKVLAILTPKGDREAAAATTLMRCLYRRPDLTAFIARERPDFGVALAKAKHVFVFEFTEAFVSALLKDPNSALYAEVFDNQNERTDGYIFADHNKLLKALVGDADTANQLGISDPILRVAMSGLNEDLTPEYRAYLNGPATRFYESGRWRDQTFVCIRMLDLAVDAGLQQSIPWHMSLYEMPKVVEALLDVYVVDPTAEERFEEWPTRAAYLIYAAFEAMRRWIRPVTRLPDGAHHLALETEAPRHQNSSIPKSAILAMGAAARKLVLADAVEARVKRQVLDLVLSCLRDLPETGDRSGFRRALVNSLAAGGVLQKSDHRRPMLALIADMDPVLRYDVQDLRKALGEKARRPARKRS
jgi:hypothetical protein